MALIAEAFMAAGGWTIGSIVLALVVGETIRLRDNQK